MSTYDALEPVIFVEHLKHTFGEGETSTQVLTDINLSIAPGEIVIMTGPSGSGKTTLLTLVAGLRQVQAGSVRVLGQEMKGKSDRELVQVRKRIGFIFQRHNLFESLTAHQNVRMAIELNDPIPPDRDRRASEMLQKLFWREEEHGRENSKPDHLSGGQRQRVAIARALVNQPQLVLADEPTAALDGKSAEVVMDLLRGLANTGSTILIVTHDNKILERADRIVSMAKGQIVSNVLLKESKLVIGYLKKCYAFAGLTPDELTHVFEEMDRDTHQPGEAIVRQGDPGDKFYLIRSGEVDVIVDEGEPTARVVNTLREGDFFGEVALMEEKPRNATVRAKSVVETYTLGKEPFQLARERSTPFVNQIERVYFQRQ